MKITRSENKLIIDLTEIEARWDIRQFIQVKLDILQSVDLIIDLLEEIDLNNNIYFSDEDQTTLLRQNFTVILMNAKKQLDYLKDKNTHVRY